ncbi:hypothetical protein HMPREF9123_1371 [Neisseria bacilliformis ATCC BAA-1200]|uniref:Uncharacterized protein n=1 Tax=Neisseria bacilliformis ATCC BAA-1200 TaxID=888742 RepID=F2BCE3_9NEIS|nr:hypothetical protein HMPREF9123_1371 [Neisseria bacilliformis ATCC BAA-1200]
MGRHTLHRGGMVGHRHDRGRLKNRESAFQTAFFVKTLPA